MEDYSRVLYYWGPLIQCKPVISSSSKYLLAALESTIKVFTTATGSLVTTLNGHKNEIVGLSSLEALEDHFISCDESGKTCVWNLQKEIKGSPLKENCNLKINKPKVKSSTVATLISRGKLDEVIVAVRDDKNEMGRLLFYNKPFRAKQAKPSHTEMGVRLGHGKVAVSQYGDFIVYLGKKGLTIMSLDFSKVKSHLVGQREITCVACHPSMLSVATGDCSGQIVLWYNLFDKPVKNDFHWHSLPVADLAFSISGAELYSGGGECVLVKWQLTANTRTFLPRLGMPIKYIVTDMKNKKIVCAHVDSSFTVLSAKDFRLEGSIQGVSLSVDSDEPYRAGFTYDPRSKAVILNGKSGHVQFYDLFHNKLLYQLDIVRDNYINPERYQKMYNTEVEKVAVSTDGSWLATLEYRDDFESSREIRLKFWHFNNEKQSWFLNTGIEMPHDKYVNGLTFNSASKSANTSVCVSCSDDGKFKIWEVVDNSDIHRQSTVWRCRSVGFYRHLPATTVTIAPDGSLIAAGFSNILTLWTADQCHLKGTLSQPYLKEDLRQIEFGRAEKCGAMAVSRSENWLCGWNLLTCTMSWRVMIKSTCMAVDPMSSYMVVFSSDGDAFVIEPQNTLVLTRLEKILSKPAVCAAFVPRSRKHTSSTPWNEESQLFIIDKAQRLKLIEPKGDIHAAEAAMEGVVEKLVQDTAALPALTPFASLIAQTKASDVVEQKIDQIDSASFGIQVQKSSQILQQVLDDARVYRLDDITSLMKMFCNIVLVDSNTSEVKKELEDAQTQGKGGNLKKKKKSQLKGLKRNADQEAVETSELKTNKSEDKKKKKRDLKRGFASEFEDLLGILS